eukprot:sb/3471630/
MGHRVIADRDNNSINNNSINTQMRESENDLLLSSHNHHFLARCVKVTASLAPREIPCGRPPGISQKSKISHRLFKLDKSRFLPTNLDPLNTMLPTEKLSKARTKISILSMFLTFESFSVGSIVFSGSKLVGKNRDLSNLNKRWEILLFWEIPGGRPQGISRGAREAVTFYNILIDFICNL